MNRLLFWATLTLVFISAVNSWAGLIEIDGEFADWEKIREYPDPGGDTFGGAADDTLDILTWKICNDEEFLYVMVTTKESLAQGQTDRGAYQTVLDTDNNYVTGLQTDTETPYPPHERPMGVDRYISIETKKGVYLGIGMEGYVPDANNIDQDEAVPGAVTQAFVVDNRYELKADLKSLEVKLPSTTIRVAILHYSEAGTVDWTMPAIDYTLGDFEQAVTAAGKLSLTWGQIKGHKDN